MSQYIRGDDSPILHYQSDAVTARPFNLHAHRCAGFAMFQRIADQVRRQLSDPRAVAVDGIRYLKAGLDDAPRGRRSQFVDDLFKNRLQRPVGVAAQRNAAAQPSAARPKIILS